MLFQEIKLAKNLRMNETQRMLQRYYRKRGWDERGVPKKLTLEKLGLSDVAKQLPKYVKLSE